MRSNSLLGAYAYPSPTSARPHAPTNVDGDVFSYDANGNMLIGLNGKVMTYDGENRPLSVTNSAGTTTYEYGPDGERLKNINPDGTITLYLQRSEIRDFGDAANESVLVYPFGNYREVAGALSVLHRDHLNSVRAISDAGLQYLNARYFASEMGRFFAAEQV